MKEKINFNFHYYISDLDMLSKARTLISKLAGDVEHIIYDKIESIDKSICDGVFIVDSSLDFFTEHIATEDKNNILIVINDILNDYQDYPYEVYISKSRVLTSLSAIIFDLKNTSKYNNNYFCVEINNIVLNSPAPCDVYLKISDDKYLKCIYKDDIYDEDSKKRFLKKSHFLWVEKADFFLFGDFLYGLDDLEKEINVPFSAENIDHMALIHDMAHSCGISDKTIATVEKTLENIKTNANSKLKNLFDNFEELNGSFLYSHSYLTGLLCVELATKQSWFKHQHIDKLTMASIVHDLGYKDKENALNEGLPKSKVMQIEGQDREDILNHIDNILKILENANVIDSDIINIIQKHHGARGDDSYPNKSFATEMDLLSGIFLLSHCFVVSYFKMSFDKSKIDKILAYINLIYNKGNLKTIFPDFSAHVKELISKQ